jgi:cytoskeletal protein RodZ
MSRKRKNKTLKINENENINTLGFKLKLAREKRSLSINDIHLKTKIPISSIKDLESENWNNLPAPVYSKGFIKSYSKEVGLDYSEIIGLFPKYEEPKVVVNKKISNIQPSIAFFHNNNEEKNKEKDEGRLSTSFLIFIFLVLTALSVSYFASKSEIKQSNQPSASEQSTQYKTNL